jgi:hypothetical protein
MSKGSRVAVGIGAAAVVGAAAIANGRAAFERRIAREIDELFAAGGGAAPAVVSEAEVAGLPDPVRRWLRWAGVVGRQRPTTVRLRQGGRFRLAANRPWLPFTAAEYFTTDPPGFVWTTTMRLAPMLKIVGRDRYMAGHGSIAMRLLGLLPVADAAGAQLDQGALLRYLNETMWFPAGVTMPYIAWEAVDDRSARATMSYGGLAATATFYFDEHGRPVDVVADRFDLAHGRLERWSTPLRAYGEFAGVRMPTEGEGVWRYDGGDFPYISVRVTDLEYDWPARY